MALSLNDLLTPPDEDEVAEGFLAFLAAVLFPVTAWQPGGVARTMARLVARGVTKTGEVVSALAKGGLLSTSTGELLTMLAREVYNVFRQSATFAQGQVALQLSSALAGPYTFTVGQLWLVWNGKRYRTTTAGTLTYPDTLILSLKAESPGAAYNAPDGLMTLETPLAGLLVTASTITTQGTDAESDDSLRARCRGKWEQVGSALGVDGFEAVTRGASAEVTRVKVLENTPDPGKVRVRVAGASGPLSAPSLALVDAFLQVRRPLCVVVQALNATATGVPVVGTVRITGTHPNSAQAFAQAQDALYALEAALPIGGTVRLSDLYQAIESIPGVESSLLSAPVGDLALGAEAIATFALTLTPVYL